MPSRKRSTLHRPWRTCGRRERETGAGRPLERSSCRLRFRCGERHPDRRDAVVLRGSAVERRSWSARLRSVRVSPLPSERADDAGCPLDAEEGNVVVRVRHQSHAAVERQLSLCTRSVTRPSLGPGTRARRSSLTSPVKAVEGGAPNGGSRLGKPGNRRNQHRHFARVDEARLDAHPTLERERVMRQKRKEVAASVPSRFESSRSQCPHVSCSCRSRQRRHLVSNKPPCSTLEKGTRRE
jgi:hypothetical protein